MTRRVRMVLPHAESYQRDTLTIAPRARDLEGACMGFLSNGWPSLEVVYEELRLALSHEYNVARFLDVHKSIKEGPVSAQDMQRLAAECAVVVNGLGN